MAVRRNARCACYLTRSRHDTMREHATQMSQMNMRRFVFGSPSKQLRCVSLNRTPSMALSLRRLV